MIHPTPTPPDERAHLLVAHRMLHEAAAAVGRAAQALAAVPGGRQPALEMTLSVIVGSRDRVAARLEELS